MNKQPNKVTDFKEKQTNLDLTRSSLWQRLLILLNLNLILPLQLLVVGCESQEPTRLLRE